MKKDYTQLSKDILNFIGGNDNIEFVMNCATRLRFTLNDIEKTDTESIKNLDGVLDVVVKDGQYQVCIGTDVVELFDELKKVANFPEDKYIKKKNGFIGTISEFLSK